MLQMISTYKQRIVHNNTLPDVELQCTRTMRHDMHQRMARIPLVEKTSSQLWISIIDLHFHIDSVSRFATVQYFLLETNKRHIYIIRIDLDPSDHLRSKAQRRFHAPNTVSCLKLLWSYTTKFLLSTAFAIKRPASSNPSHSR